MNSQEQEDDRNLAPLTPTGAEIFFRVIGIDAETVYPIEQLSPASLAYIGDAVYEIYIRTRYLLPPKRIADYHNQVVAQVRAEAQAAYLQALEPLLTDFEKEILRRGRNATKGHPRRLSRSRRKLCPAKAESLRPEIYQQATSLETLIGYLYLKNPQRLNQLLEKLG